MNAIFLQLMESCQEKSMENQVNKEINFLFI